MTILLLANSGLESVFLEHFYQNGLGNIGCLFQWLDHWLESNAGWRLELRLCGDLLMILEEKLKR